MSKKKAVLTWVILAFMTMVNSGCALIGTAVSAGVAYGIYAATRKK